MNVVFCITAPQIAGSLVLVPRSRGSLFLVLILIRHFGRLDLNLRLLQDGIVLTGEFKRSDGYDALATWLPSGRASRWTSRPSRSTVKSIGTPARYWT